MAVFCPIVKKRVVYLQCLDCEEKTCRRSNITDDEDDEKNRKKEKEDVRTRQY